MIAEPLLTLMLFGLWWRFLEWLVVAFLVFVGLRLLIAGVERMMERRAR